MTHEELIERLNTICKNNGFDYAKNLGNYKGEDIYKPEFNDGGDVLFGRPCYLHVKGDRNRRSRNHKEVSKVMNYFFPDGVD